MAVIGMTPTSPFLVEPRSVADDGFAPMNHSIQPFHGSPTVRPVVRGTACRWLLSLALLAAQAVNADMATNFVAKLAPVPPCPACQAAARANGIPWSGINPLAQTNALTPGDSETTLITLHEKGQPNTQWLLYFQAVAGTNTALPKPDNPMVLYTSTGGKYEFTNWPATIRVRTLGPFTEPRLIRGRPGNQPVLKDKSARVTVDQGLLGLGLDQTVAALYRINTFEKQNHNKIRFNFGISDQAFGSAEIRREHAAAELMHMTPQEERAMAGGFPALYGYFSSVQETPELDTILFKVLSLPGVWSLVKNLGLSAGLAVGSPRNRVGPLSLPDWGLSSRASLYALPVEVTLNRHHALTLTLIVTAPHPPFLVCGGIVGFLAENPDDPENYLMLRVINAHD
jgi:hypothetical protein